MRKVEQYVSGNSMKSGPSNLFRNFVKASSLASGMIVTLLVVCSLFFTLIPVGSLMNVVVGNSMSPTLNSGQIIFSTFGEVERGDMVTLQLPELGLESAKKTLVKRVVGMPGDEILLTPTGVYVNDVAIDESYLSESAKSKTYEDNQINHIVLGDDEYFVLGDNRGASTDSRKLGAIEAKDICYVQSETPTLRSLVDLVIIIALFFVGFFTCTFAENGVTRLLYCLWRKANRVADCSCDNQEQDIEKRGDYNEN